MSISFWVVNSLFWMSGGTFYRSAESSRSTKSETMRSSVERAVRWCGAGDPSGCVSKPGAVHPGRLT